MQESQSPVAVGDIVAGKYRVERVLGAGGMGIVVAAQHLQLRQLVAIKFVLPDALGNAEAVERFIREARAAVRLRSEHVARVLDVGTLRSGAPYMVMEFLEGLDLEALLAREAPLAIERVAQCIIQACEALAEAHSLGIVHRDLKPQNLFLTRSVGGAPLLKVLDFGVSKMDSFTGTRGLTRTSAMMGSPLYMSPEQMRSARDATVRSDIWALGVILYQLLAGRLPFEAESIPELCLKVALEQPVPLRVHRADVPLALEAIVMRCLAKDPAQRFATAAELSAALEPFAPPEARGSVERADQIVRGMRPPEAGLPVGIATPNLLASPPLSPPLAPREPTPTPWSSSRSTKKKHGPWRVVVAVLALALGVAGTFVLLDLVEEDHVHVSRPAALQSATVTFAPTGATSKLPATTPASPPPPFTPDAGRFFVPRPRGSAPAPQDDIPTMR